MKAHRSRFSQIKQQFELRKMMAAYIGAEQQIIQNSSNGMADGMTPEKFHFDFVQGEDGEMFVEQVTVKDMQIRKLEEQLQEMEEQGRKLLENENYELLQELREIYDLTVTQLTKLRGSGKA